MMKMLIIFVAIRVKSIFASSISPLATLAMIFGLFSPLVKAQSITPANDGTGTVITTEGNKIDISGGSLSSDRTNLFHSFSQFGLDANQTANFLSQPSIQNILGRVTGNNASLINGLIQVTGGNSNLYLINPAGIIFGSSASLNVPAAFTATTANGIGFGNNQWFNAIGANNYANLIGNPTEFAFTSSQGGSIFNAGNLAVGEAQSLMLLGGMVLNTGTLTAPNGNVTIMAVPAEKIVRVTASNSLFSLDLPVETKNQINPQPFSPRSLPSLLTGGNVKKVTGVTVENGVVKLISTNTAIPTDVGTTIVSGKVSVSNSPEAVNNVSNNTGQINILGDRIALLNANINASGSNGGTVLIGGDYQGKGTVPNASHTYISSDSAIAADALGNGNGGKVIVWADDTTRFFGNITARGGAIAGNGGLVETSGKLSLDVTGSKVDASAAKGQPGTWLLDPTDINIVSGGSGTPSGGLFDPANNSDIDPLTIATALDNGTDVTITTSSGTGGNGDITLTDGINQTGGGTASLTLTSRQFLNPNYLININLSSTGNLTFNLNQVNPETNASTDSIQNAIDAIGTVAGNSIINLGAGTYTGNTVNIFEKTLTLNGAGASNTIFDGNNINQVFGIFSQGTVTINNLAIINGRGFGLDGGGIAYFSSSSGTLNVNNVTFTDNSTEFNIEGGGNGGAIYSEYGTLNVNNSTLNSNSATDGNGGGIYSSYSTLNVNNSTFSGNLASDGLGGGIYNISDNQSGLNVNNSTFIGNSAIEGGGIYDDGINGGRLDFNNSNFISNSATSGNGGGIYNNDTTGNVNNSTFSGNLASNGRGGGIYNEGVFINVLTVNNSTFNANSAIDGGGIYNNIGVSLNVNNSTFASNAAINGNGGGIYNSLDTLNVNNSTLSGNSATDGGGILSESRAPTTLKNTIVAGNTSSQNPDVSGVLLGSSSNNLIGDGTGTTGISNGVSGNQVGTTAIPINPLLSVLGNYGGSTQTFALLTGSPAINAGISDTNITTDQRGISRPQDTTPDIGAFELVGYTLTATAGSGQSAIANNPFSTPLQATVTENGFNLPIPGITVNFTAPTTGASANFTGNTTLITDSTGNVSIPVTANTVAGSYAVTANSGTLTPANFSLINNPDIAAAIIATGGTPQNTIVNTGFTNPLQARVQDQYGNAIANAIVTFNAPTSGATANFTGNTSLTTDSSGNVSIPVTANTVAGSYNITANSGALTPASFSLINNPDVAAAIIATGGTPQSTIVNTAFTNPLQAKVQDQYGNAIANAIVTFNAPTSGATANFTGNTTLTTDSAGNVSIPVTANTIAGGYAVTASSGALTPANFSLINNPDVAFSIIATGGTPQSTVVNTAFTNPLQAKVQDQYGNAIANATVTFNAPTSGATAGFTGNTTLTTDSAGNVSIPVTANTVAGNYAVTASSGALTPANFSLINNPDVAFSIIATGGTPQTTVVNTAFTNPLQARVQDQYGNAIANATVTFNAPTSGATAGFTGNTTLTTDSAGNVSIPVIANTVAGGYAVTANSGALTPANFSLINNPDVAFSIIATGGTLQSTVVNTAFTNPLQARVQDQYGNAIANATVTFNAPTTGATANFTGNTSLTTNSSGNVSIPVTANTVEGNYTVTANSGALTPANFSLTNNAASEVPTTPTVPIDTPNPEVLKKPPSTQIPVTINSAPEVVLDTAVANIEQEYTTEYKEYLGEEAKPNLEAPNTARNILQQISDATGIQPALIYVNFIPTSVSPAITLKQNKAKIQPSPNDRLELLIVTAQGLPIRKVLPVTRSQVIGTAQTFIKDITKSARNNSYKDPAKKLYEWLITPLEPELQARKVNNIAFIMDAGLRSLPVAALYDGQKYLVESYSVGLMPSLSLTDTKFVDIKKAEVLGMGASEFRNQNPLPAVPTELVTITSRLWQGNFFLNESFTLTNLQKQRQQKPFGIIHLATHAEFEPGDRGNSYIQMWDSQLKMDQLRKLGWNNPPVQLVVLSSCRTAIGDKEAELGFAGFAVQAGVRTALASLWYVSDEGTLGLMSEFYEQLKKAPIKAEALRQAQIAMIKGKVRLQDGKLKTSNVNVTLPPILAELGNQELRHPYYWSAFTLIGNPW
ncbi:CHAT domain-containing protein [Calothrix membranacea FACHB-236]|nr:CHAT domain-containing protein [Calothrix membranacea FACHB-236]